MQKSSFNKLIIALLRFHKISDVKHAKDKFKLKYIILLTNLHEVISDLITTTPN